MIVPLHIRVLLDRTRLRILHDTQNASGEEFCGGLQFEEFCLLIAEYSRLPQNVCDMVCEYPGIHEVNEAVHAVDPADIQEAVNEEPNEAERILLRELYRFVYGETI